MSILHTTAEFYRLTFRPAASSGRKLQNVQFATFDTGVKAKNESLDANGNTIFYDQFIKFSTTGGVLEEDDAGDLLLEQLTDEEKKKEYLEMLKKAHPDFESVTEVNPAASRSINGSSDDDSGLDMLWIIIIAVGGAALCCCCAALYFAAIKSRGNVEQEEEYDNENDVDQDAPEGPVPVYEHSEKSGEELFSNETEHKSVPYGQDDDDNDYGSARDESHEESEASSFRGELG